MADRYDRSIKVRQSTIDEIKKLGMSKAIERANSSDDKEFVEGARRFYGGNRVKGGGSAESQASNAVQRAKQTGRAQPVKNMGGDSKPQATQSAPTPAPSSGPPQAAIGRRLTGMAESLGAPSKAKAPKGPKKPTAFEQAAK